MHELIRMKSAEIQTNLCEEIGRNEVREGESEGQEKRTHSVADDMIELEKVQKITNNARTCLGLIDQNMLRNVTVESETILRPGTGKWKRLAKPGNHGHDLTKELPVEYLQESGKKKLIELEKAEVDKQKGTRSVKRVKSQQKENEENPERWW